jgi:hypothetical protein
MSDDKQQTRYTGLDRRTPRAETDIVIPGVAVPPKAFKTGGRHSAITNNLYNWHSYKNWADKVRGSWGDKK